MLRKEIPAPLRFVKLELQLGLFILPSAVNCSAGLFKDGRSGPVILGIIILIICPGPLVIYTAYQLYKMIVMPSSFLRRLVYEQDECVHICTCISLY